MFFKLLTLLLAAAAMASARVPISPAPLDLTGYDAPDVDLLVRKGIEQVRGVERRMTTDFSIDKTWHDQTLFQGAWNDTQLDDAFSGKEKTSLEVTCRDCYTKGTVTAHIVDNIFHPTIKLEFTGVEAYAHLGVAINSHQNFAINLYTSNTPAGMGFPGLSVGIVFFVDLVFDLTEEIELNTGFYVKLPDDAYLEADIFEGDIQDSFFDGMAGRTLPISVVIGKATIKAALRLRVQCGVDIGFGEIGLGATAAVGVYANVIEFVTVIQTTPTCPLETEMWLDLNVGAYAKFDVVVEWETLGPAPTVSTTLLEAPTLRRCWIDGVPGPAETVTGPPRIAPGFSTYVTDTAAPAPSQTGQYPTAHDASTKPLITPGPALPGTSGYPAAPHHYASGGFNASLSRSPARYANSSRPAAAELVTSTVYSTATYALRRCAVPGVMNCPLEFGRDLTVTRTVDAFTTVCPYSETITYPSASRAAGAHQASAPPVPIADIRTLPGEVVALSPCATPIRATFVPPPWASSIAALPGKPAAASGRINLSPDPSSLSHTTPPAFLSSSLRPLPLTQNSDTLGSPSSPSLPFQSTYAPASSYSTHTEPTAPEWPVSSATTRLSVPPSYPMASVSPGSPSAPANERPAPSTAAAAAAPALGAGSKVLQTAIAPLLAIVTSLGLLLSL